MSGSLLKDDPNGPAESAARRDGLRALLPTLDARLPRFTTGVEDVDADIFAAFLDYLGQLGDEIAGSLAGGDMDRVRAIGHSIKGMGGSCGAPEISVLGEELQFAAQAGDRARCEALLDGLRRWRGSYPPAAGGPPA